MNQPLNLQPARSLFALIVVAALSIVFTGCKKEEVKSIEPALGEAFLFCEDSCVVNMPNVFTPDGDGINEFVFVSGRQFTLTEFTVRDVFSNLIYTTTSAQDSWDGRLPYTAAKVAPGTYYYHLVFTTYQGTVVNVTRPVQLVLNHYSPCFANDIAPVFGDQFDPRVCGISYPTNDLICLL